MLPLTTKDLPIGSIVRIAKSITFHDESLRKLCNPFNVVGTIHEVTGHHYAGDVYLDNNGWSVNPERLEKLGFALYSITPKMTEELGGVLASLEPGERFVLSDDNKGQYSHVLTYLDREQNHAHYADRNGKWISKLLQAGAIVKGVYEEEPQEFNSVFDAPVGMVLRYTVEGELAAGAHYPYVMNTGLGLWVYDVTYWRFIPRAALGVGDVPYMHNLQVCWSIPVCWQEAFEYPAQSRDLNNHRNKLIKVANNA